MVSYPSSFSPVRPNLDYSFEDHNVDLVKKIPKITVASGATGNDSLEDLGYPATLMTLHGIILVVVSTRADSETGTYSSLY